MKTLKPHLINFILLIFVLFSFVLSKPLFITSNSNVQSYVAGFKNGNTDAFRSGRLDSMNSSDTAFDDELGHIISEDNDHAHCSKIWRNREFKEFEVDFSNNAEFLDLLKKCFSKSTFIISFNDILKEYSIINKSKKVSVVNQIQTENAPGIASQVLKNNAPWLFRRVEYDITNKEFCNDKLVALTIRFRRIFENAIVRKGTSYIEINMDSFGNVDEIKVKWPSFRKIYEEKAIENTVEIGKGFENAKDEINNRYSEIFDPQNKSVTYKAIKGNISGIALGWFPAEVGEKTILTPCLSFVSFLEFENGQKCQQIIDIPLLTKYYPK